MKRKILLSLFVVICLLHCGCGRNAPPIGAVLIGGATPQPTSTPLPIRNYYWGLTITAVNGMQITNFISRDAVGFQGKCLTNTALESQMMWSFKDLNFPKNNMTGYPDLCVGDFYPFIPKPIELSINRPYTGTGRNYPLNYEVKLLLCSDEKVDYNSMTICQDELAQLRQEYIDFGAEDIPETEDFDQYVPESPFSNLLVRGNKNSVCLKHKHWIVSDLWNHAILVEWGVYTDLQIEIYITCGYRCPAGNCRVVKNWKKNSKHLAGVAFDFDQGDNNKTNSQLNYRIAKHIMDNWDPSRVILYDQNNTMYYETQVNDYKVIPAEYDAETSEIIFTSGHVDWRVSGF